MTTSTYNQFPDSLPAPQPAVLEVDEAILAARAFWGATVHIKEQQVGGVVSYDIAATHPGKGEEVVAAAVTKELAGEDLVKQMMRSERVFSKSPIASIQMAPNVSVSLSALERYAPSMAPSEEIYEIPEYLKPITTNSHEVPTYQKTVEKTGWEQSVRGLVEMYVGKYPDGKALAERLGIVSLDYLTPGQAARLSTEFVRSVSKYTNDSQGKPDGDRADQSTAMQLLEEGLRERGDSSWQGNGVCRNIAANVKSVFEALKATQGTLTMLGNTYCVVDAGYGGEGYKDKRNDPFSNDFGKSSGHAWNIFTTLDKLGSANITVVDATWSLGATQEQAVESADFTRERSAPIIGEMFAASTEKEHAFHGIAEYYAALAYGQPGSSQDRRERLRTFALTEYLKIAATFPDGVEGVGVPDVLLGAASRIKSNLEPKELKVLYSHDKANGSLNEDRLSAIVKGMYAKNTVLNGRYLADRFVFPEADLQSFVFDALGDDTVIKMAEVSPALRIRLRELKPELLQPFDPEKYIADSNELSELATRAGIRERDPKRIVQQITRLIRLAARGNGAAEDIISSVDDYNLVKSAPGILKTLKKNNSKSK